MTTLTIEDLQRIMTECAGVDDPADLSGDIADVPFEQLGYDSLALIESVARISQELGVRIPEPELSELQTPRHLLDFVNSVVPAGAGT